MLVHAHAWRCRVAMCVQMAGLRSLLRAREDMSAAMFKSQKRLYTLQTAPPDKLDRKAR